MGRKNNITNVTFASEGENNPMRSGHVSTQAAIKREKRKPLEIERKPDGNQALPSRTESKKR